MRGSLALTILLAACTGDGSNGLAIGKPAPSYAATSITGDSVSLSQLAGKPVLLNIWATWCAPCRQEIPYLVELYARHRAHGLEIVGVSLDAPGADQQIREFAAEMGMVYPLWLDPSHRATATFLAFGVPASYLVDRGGVLRWKHVGVLRPTNAAFSAALNAMLRETAP